MSVGQCFRKVRLSAEGAAHRWEVRRWSRFSRSYRRYLTHLGGLKGIMMLVCWIVLLVTAPVGFGILGLLGVGVIAGVNSTSQYYIKYMQKIGMQK